MTSLLSTSDITRLQAVVTATSPDTCTISRPTATTSGAGTALTYASVATGVACRVNPVAFRPDEREHGGRVASITRWEITLPASQDAKPKDRILALSKVFEVLEVKARRSWEVRTRVTCAEVK